MKSNANKRAANVIFGIAAALFGAASIVKVDDVPQPGSDIFSPPAVEAGELAVFSVQGLDTKWMILPEVNMTIYGEGNSFMATSFRGAGTYTVIAAYSVDGVVQLRRTTIEVVDSSVFDEEQLPAPEAPEPAPEPEQPVAPTTNFPEVKVKISESAKKSELDKEVAKQLANNFRLVVKDIESGVIDNPRQVTTSTAIANRRLNLTSKTAVDIQETITRAKLSGQLTELAHYQDLWTQIAEGLEDYAQGSTKNG